jgi:hypothetical protein
MDMLLLMGGMKKPSISMNSINEARTGFCIPYEQFKGAIKWSFSFVIIIRLI